VASQRIQFYAKLAHTYAQSKRLSRPGTGGVHRLEQLFAAAPLRHKL